MRRAAEAQNALLNEAKRTPGNLDQFDHWRIGLLLATEPNLNALTTDDKRRICGVLCIATFPNLLYRRLPTRLRVEIRPTPRLSNRLRCREVPPGLGVRQSSGA